MREFDTQTRAWLSAEWRSRYLLEQVRLPLPRLPGSISAEDAEIDLVFGGVREVPGGVAIYCQPIPAKPGVEIRAEEFGHGTRPMTCT